jgi:hypothetical protein
MKHLNIQASVAHLSFQETAVKFMLFIFSLVVMRKSQDKENINFSNTKQQQSAPHVICRSFEISKIISSPHLKTINEDNAKNTSSQKKKRSYFEMVQDHRPN